MSASIKKVKKICTCENCGNEAEKVVTCTLQETDTTSFETDAVDAREPGHYPSQIKGSGTCSTSGNETDVWVEL